MIKRTETQTTKKAEKKDRTQERRRERRKKVQQHDDTQLGQSGNILNEKPEGTPNSDDRDITSTGAACARIARVWPDFLARRRGSAWLV